MADALAKLYVEVTTACNLDCVMCVRRVWDEPLGTMPLANFARLMEQVAALTAPPTIHLSGYGEPMAHPHFLDLVRLAKATGAKVEATTNGNLLDGETAQALIDLDLDRLVVSAPARPRRVTRRFGSGPASNGWWTICANSSVCGCGVGGGTATRNWRWPSSP